jgi:hypothetical protein
LILSQMANYAFITLVGCLSKNFLSNDQGQVLTTGKTQ